MRTSRRAILVGMPLMACTPTFTRAVQVGKTAPRSWTFDLFGVPPSGLAIGELGAAARSGDLPVVSRVVPEELQGVGFRLAEVERIESIRSSSGLLALVRGVGPRADPYDVLPCGVPSIQYCGPMRKLEAMLPNGIAYYSSSSRQLFVYPDRRTWLFTRGVPVERTLAWLRETPAPPAPLAGEPGAIAWRQEKRVFASLGLPDSNAVSAVLGQDKIFATSTAFFKPPPAGPVPVLHRLHFPDAETAERATVDLRRLLRGAPPACCDELASFWLRSIHDVSRDGDDLVIRSAMRRDGFR